MGVIICFIFVVLCFDLVIPQGSYDGDVCVDRNTNMTGRCMEAERCQPAKDDLRIKGLRPTICSFTGNTVIVCCREGLNPSKSGTQSTADTIQRGDRKRVSEKKCEEYSKSVTQTVEFISLLPNAEVMSISSPACPDYDTPLGPIGGDVANVGQFPHMAAIGWPKTSGGHSFLCGGTLISDKFILTMGHCLKYRPDPKLSTQDPTVVRLGDQNLNPDVEDGAYPVEIPITRIVKHPDYKPPYPYSDIGLLELGKKVDFNGAIRPACLWSKPDLEDQSRAIATGWGSDLTSQELRKASFELIEYSVCEKLMLKNIDITRRGLAPSQLCAAVSRNRRDRCEDYGSGPLQLRLKDNRCIFYVVGVGPSGKKCSSPDYLTVFTRVFSYLDWIESVVWPNEA